MNGYSFKNLLGIATGTQKSQTSLLVPTAISRFAPLMGLSPEEALWKHTMFPYATAFMSSSNTIELARNLLSAENSSTKAGPFVKPIIKCLQTQNLCLDCAKEDISRFGNHYTRRQHCLPGVIFCPKHFTPLIKTKFPFTTSSRSPLLYEAPEVSVSPEPPSVIDRLIISNSLLALGREKNNRADDWVEKYRDAARLKGYGHSQRELNTKNFCKDFYDWIPKSLLGMMNCAFNPDSRGAWPSLALRKSRYFTTPKHVLLNAFLSNSLSPSLQIRKKPGTRKRDYVEIDLILSLELIAEKNSALIKNESATELLKRLGKFGLYRHNRAFLPKTQSIVKQIYSDRIKSSKF